MLFALLVMTIVVVVLSLHYIILEFHCFISYPTAVLSLSDNSLTGSIPNEISLLTKLSEFNVI